MYDTTFLHMATNLSTSWSKIFEQLYNVFLKGETLPFCITCHSYGCYEKLSRDLRDWSELSGMFLNI